MELTQSQKFILLLIQQKPSYRFVLKTKNMLAIFAIGIWELSQLGLIQIKHKSIRLYNEKEEQDSCHECHNELFQMIAKEDTHDKSYLIEKHVIHRSKELRKYINSIINSLIEAGYIVIDNKGITRRYICNYKMKDIRLDDEMEQLSDYILYRLRYKKRKDMEYLAFEKYISDYVNSFFLEYKYNKFEWIGIAIVSFFIGD